MSVATGRRRGGEVTAMLLQRCGGRPSRLSTPSGSCSPFLWICRAVAVARRRDSGDEPADRRRGRVRLVSCGRAVAGTVLAQRHDGRDRADERRADRAARGDATASAARRRTDPHRPAARPRQADGTGADRAPPRRRTRSSRSTRSSRPAAPTATTTRSSATASSPATARSTAGTSSSSARTSRSSAVRCPRRTPRRSAR